MVQTIYAHSATDLFTVDPTSWTLTHVGSFGVDDTMFDLAVTPDGNIWSIGASASLYQVDPGTAQATYVMAASGNALTGLPDGTLLGSSAGFTELVQIDPAGQTDTVIGSFGSGYDTSGDLLLTDGGTLYGTSLGGTADILFTADPASGLATAVGSTGFLDVWGLASYDGMLLGFTNEGQILQLDPATGAGTVLATTSLSFYGAAVSPAVPAGCE